MEEITILNNFLPFQVLEIDNEKNINEIIKKWKTSKAQIIYNNENLKKGDKIVLKNLNLKTHIVKPMETLDEIAKKYNVSKEEILEKNKISQLFIGQQLFI
ncbi:MAG: LysM domain-containing protein [Clostridia bacterium]|nr:LysM domain-containing protein [Clostridia bacterium]